LSVIFFSSATCSVGSVTVMRVVSAIAVSILRYARTCSLFAAVGPVGGSRGDCPFEQELRWAVVRRASSAGPVAVCLDPLRALGGGFRQRQVQNSDVLSDRPPDAACDHAPVLCQIDTDHAHLDAENSRAERHGKALLDHREEAGDLLIPVHEGALALDTIVGELGEVLLDRAPARQADTDITVYKSVGAAFLDAATARLAYEQALAAGVGVRFTFA
jgi:hypothetical protein